MKLSSITFLFWAFLSLISINCFAQNEKLSISTRSGNGILIASADSSYVMAINGRIQSVFETRSDANANTATTDFLLRRCRLNIEGKAFSPHFSYRIQLGFAHGDISSSNSSAQNNLILRDAMLFYEPVKWLRFGFGQTKLPGNRQRLISSASLQLVERSISNNNFTLDRDKGLWIYNQFKINKSILKSTIAISSGEGRIVSDKNGKLCYSGRIEFLPFGNFSGKGDYTEADTEKEQKPKLAIAGAYSFNESATRTMGQLGDYLYNSESANIQYYGADLLFKFKGFSIEAEYYNRNSNKGVIANLNDNAQLNYVISGNTLMLQSGYFITKRNEIACRYAQITPNNSVASIMKSQKEYVVGFSHYFRKHSLKLQNDLTFLENGSSQILIYRLSGVATF